MNFIIKNFVSYFSISLLSTIIFIWYLKYKSYPGGAVGMAPLLIMLNSLIAITISLIIIQIIKIVSKTELSLIKSNWMYTLIYILSLIFYFGSNPYEKHNDEMFKNVDLWSYFCEIISLFFVNGILLIRKNFA